MLCYKYIYIYILAKFNLRYVGFSTWGSLGFASTQVFCRRDKIPLPSVNVVGCFKTGNVGSRLGFVIFRSFFKDLFKFCYNDIKAQLLYYMTISGLIKLFKNHFPARKNAHKKSKFQYFINFTKWLTSASKIFRYILSFSSTRAYLTSPCDILCPQFAISMWNVHFSFTNNIFYFFIVRHFVQLRIYGNARLGYHGCHSTPKRYLLPTNISDVFSSASWWKILKF